MMHDEIMYKMASLAMEKEAKLGKKIKPGIKKLYRGYINAMKGYPEEVSIPKDNIRYAKDKLRQYPNDELVRETLYDSKKLLRNLRGRTYAARGATGAAALGGGYGAYRAVRKRPAE